jgi:hypothetical protein
MNRRRTDALVVDPLSIETEEDPEEDEDPAEEGP